MKSNEEIQKAVQEAIKWEPLLNATEIGVIVEDGIVTLTGLVDNYYKKTEAEHAAKNVAGVKAVVEKIEVRFDSKYRRDDVDIAKDIVAALKSSWTVPSDKVSVKVEAGWVTLEGTLPWNYQKVAAKKSIETLAGVVGVTNSIIIRSDIKDEIQQNEIMEAIDRNWSIDDQNIRVDVSGNEVTLSGTVDSLYQKDETGRIAWNAPGVGKVYNKLEVVCVD